MSTQDLEQGTQEWLDARDGRINASEMGAVLDCSPFSNPKKMLKQKIADVPFFTNPAMTWGNDHEAEAVELYEYLYSMTTEETGYWTHDLEGDIKLGASPDRLVGDDGLLEVKCPYSLRDDPNPEFKSIHQLPHYWHQVQMQLFITDRKWCDFFQWAPNGHSVERVDRDPDWLNNVLERLVCFWADYQKGLANKGEPDPVGSTQRFAAAAEAYLMAKEEVKFAIERLDTAKEALQSMCEESAVESASGSGVTVTYVERRGSVDYKKIATALTDPDELKGLEESARRAGSASWRITVEGE